VLKFKRKFRRLEVKMGILDTKPVRRPRVLFW